MTVPLPDAPRPQERPAPVASHGDERVDEYAWLRDKDDPEVIAHLEAENRYTETVTAHTAGLRQDIFEEIRGRIKETDLSAPTRKGPWWYYTRTVEGSQYPIHCRRPADGPALPAGQRPADPETLPSPETVLLDVNAEAAGHEFFAVGDMEMSPDHRLVAWTADVDGGERHTLRIRDAASGADLEDVVPNTYFGLAWSADCRFVFYTRPDDTMRPWQVWRHRVGTAESEDVCVLTEEDERFFLSVGTTKDGLWVVGHAGSHTTSEVKVLAADDPEGAWLVIEPRRPGVEYSVEHRNGRFWIVTNDGAPDFRLVTAPVDEPGRQNWVPVLPPDPGVRLDGVDVFAGAVVLQERAEGSQRLRVLRDSGTPQEVPLPEDVRSVWSSANPEFDDGVARFGYTSLVTPPSVFDLDLDSLAHHLLRQQPVLGGYDPTAYRTERRWAVSSDGTRVPMSLVYPADLERNGDNPCLLYGYGSYEISIDPSFSAARLSLLERGFVFAIAHVRGGGEMGRHWYEDGKLAAKRHTFEDFVACARTLIDEGWTRPARLAARGGSAGGLLMGAALNAAPDLFAAVVAEVPFVDVVTTMSDATLPLTALEWEEWGDPISDPEAYGRMLSYSPYDNVAPLPYPAVLATGGLNDPNVGFWEPAKWVARLRRRTTSGRPVLLKTEMGSGHQGPSGRYDAWRDEAFVLAFVIDQVGDPVT